MANTKLIKEILLEFMDFCNKDESLFKGDVYCVQQYIRSSKILALGKPEPLAKNKQTKERLKPKPLPPKFPPNRRIEKLPFKWYNPSTWL